MPIKYDTKESWGATYYLKNDPEQLEHCLVGIILLPGKPKLMLSHQGIICEVYEFETSKEPDMLKKLSGGSATDEEDD